MKEFKYLQKSKADEALKYWGDFIIKSDKVQYVAVVKKNIVHFSLEVGKDTEQPFDVNNHIAQEINNLEYKEIVNLYNTAPIKIRRLMRQVRNFKSWKYLDIEEKKRNLVDSIKETNLSIGQRNVPKFTMDDNEENESEIGENSSNNDFEYLYVGQAISYKNRRFGTLGGIFKLKGFPKEYFGISNWHVIALKEELGRPLYIRDNNNTYKYGNLSWRCLDHKREAGFVHFPNLSEEKIRRENECKYHHSGKLDRVKINQEVKKCGQKTKCNRDDGKCQRGIIHSTNATIKVNSNFRDSDEPFKNQILIKNSNPNNERAFSISGDSGSIVANKKGDIVGLLFGRTEGENSFSVANNINNIFNTEFEIPQKIMINGQEETLNSFTLSEFI